MAAAAVGEVRRDMWGQEYRTASADCAAALDDYYGQTMAFRAATAAADPSCALASALAAHFVAPRDHAKAAAFPRRRSRQPRKPSPLLLVRSIDLLVLFPLPNPALTPCALCSFVCFIKDKGDGLLKEFPGISCPSRGRSSSAFYVGRPDTSLKFVQQVLRKNQDQNFIYGMLAFPLLELGRMDEAEVAARKGLAINKNDFWSQHNMCHVFQQESRFREATEFMESCSPSWTACSSFMFTHNWWHVAVCYLEGESPISKVLEVYDQNIMKELDRSDSEAAEVYLNGLGLLLRLYVRGEIGPAKERLKTLLDELKNESIWHAEWLLDLLILWALSSMNESKKQQKICWTHCDQESLRWKQRDSK
ncbi:hypothetical protein ACQ4PT_066469 [Festuca glaucescens]